MPEGLKNGFTRIANPILEALMYTNLSKREYKICLCILRNGYGYKQEQSKIFLHQGAIATVTKLNKVVIKNTLLSLQNKNIIQLEEVNKTLTFNRHFENWKVNETLTSEIRKVNKTLTFEGNKRLKKVNKTLTSEGGEVNKTLTFPEKKVNETLTKKLMKRELKSKCFINSKSLNPLQDKAFRAPKDTKDTKDTTLPKGRVPQPHQTLTEKLFFLAGIPNDEIPKNAFGFMGKQINEKGIDFISSLIAEIERKGGMIGKNKGQIIGSFGSWIENRERGASYGKSSGGAKPDKGKYTLIKEITEEDL